MTDDRSERAFRDDIRKKYAALRKRPELLERLALLEIENAKLRVIVNSWQAAKSAEIPHDEKATSASTPTGAMP